MPALQNIKNWIFDLDNTLYRADAGFFQQIDVKMTEFVSRYLQLDPLDARDIQKKYLVEYGTTLSGLMAVHGMDPSEFLVFVHDVDLSMLAPSPALRAAISNLEGRKFIFTNGSRGHAENVATYLQLWDLFDGAFGVDDVNYIPKPQRSPYVHFCDHFDIDPAAAIMFEDNLRNLEVPQAMGMKTVLIVSDADVSGEPEFARPAGRDTTAPWVDYITDDLAAWLKLNSGT